MGAFRRDRPDVGQGEAASVRAQAAVDVAGVGAESDAEPGAVAVEDRLEPCLEQGFADARRPELDVGLAVRTSPSRPAGAGPAREHGLKLVGRAGHHAEDLSVLLDPEPGRRPVRIGEHFAALKAVGLLEVVRRHLAPEEREAVVDVLFDRGVEDERLAEDAGNRLPGPVVAGRPKAAGR